jgi:hypothetical protein
MKFLVLFLLLFSSVECNELEFTQKTGENNEISLFFLDDSIKLVVPKGHSITSLQQDRDSKWIFVGISNTWKGDTFYRVFNQYKSNWIEIYETQHFPNQSLKLSGDKKFCLTHTFTGRPGSLSKVKHCLTIPELQTSTKFVKENGLIGEYDFLKFIQEKKSYDEFMEEFQRINQAHHQNLYFDNAKVNRYWFSRIQLQKCDVHLSLKQPAELIKCYQLIKRLYAGTDAALSAKIELKWINKHGIDKYIKLHSN